MRYKEKATIKIPFVWQVIGTTLDASISYLLFLAIRFVFKWLFSSFSSAAENMLLQLVIVIGCCVVGFVAVFLAILAICVLVELFNGDSEFYVEKELSPSKDFIISEKNGRLSLYFKKWWGAYYKWDGEIKTRDPAQLSYDYKQFLRNKAEDENGNKLNVVFKGKA